MIRLMNARQVVGYAYNANIDLRPYCVEIMPIEGPGAHGTNIIMWALYGPRYDVEADPDPRLVGRLILPGKPRIIDPIEGDGRSWLIEPETQDGVSTAWQLEVVPDLNESIWLDRSRNDEVLADKTLAELHRNRVSCMYSLICVERLLRTTDPKNEPVYKTYERYLEAWRGIVQKLEREIAQREAKLQPK